MSHIFPTWLLRLLLLKQELAFLEQQLLMKTLLDPILVYPHLRFWSFSLIFSGSPLVLSLIGALLRDFPNRWEYYLRQLQNKQFRRIKKSSSYDYEALDEAMSISVEMLNENFKDFYKDLSILPKDVKVPTKVIMPNLMFYNWWD